MSNEQNPPNGPFAFGGALQALAGLAGASALFAGFASFAGWQYLRAYYETLGIPFSALSFSTQDYVFATLPTVTLAFAGLLGASIGIVLGLTIPVPANLGALVAVVRRAVETVGDSIEGFTSAYFRLLSHRSPATERFARTFSRAYALILIVGYGLILAVAILVVPLILLGVWLTSVSGRDIGVAILVFTLLAFFTGFFGTAVLRRGGPRRSTLYLVFSLAFTIALSGMLMFVPRFIGQATAERHSMNTDYFIHASLVVQSPVGIPNHEQCQNAVQTQGGQACQISDVVIIIQNNGYLFVSAAANVEASDRIVYPIAESRIIQLAYTAK